MARPGFLNDNENRAYPFQFRADQALTMTRSDSVEFELPDGAIADFYSVLGLDAAWVEFTDTVYLHAVRRQSDGDFTFEFRSTAAGLDGLSVTFLRAADAAEYTADHADALAAAGGSLSGTPAEGPCGDGLVWEAGLTTGLLDGLAAILSPGQSLRALGDPPTVEPALIQDLAGTYVRSINLANAARTHAVAPAGCADSPPDVPDGDVVAGDTCIQGKIMFRAGYNCTISQNDLEGSLTIAAAVGAGAGEPCTEVAAHDGEAPPAGSSLLTGGPACGELIRSLNGLSASVVRLVPGTGVRIASDADRPGTLVVDFNLRDLVACPAFVNSSH